MKLDNYPFINLDEPAYNNYDDPVNNVDNDLIINLDDSPINDLEDHVENHLDNNIDNNLDENLITNLDDDLIQMVDSCIQTADCLNLFEYLRENSDLKLLNSLFLKLDNDISNLSNDLLEKSESVSNAVQVLSELIQAYKMSDTVRYNLSRTILFLIVDEHCSIINLKRAIHSFNLLLNQSPVVTSVVIQDPRLYGSLQILGRKISGVGDYECQALLFEALYRITCKENREYWADIWFSNNSKAKNIFLNLDPQQFELNCRKALNCINSHEEDRRVFSIIANYVSFGSLELKPPADCPFWVDFNYDSESVSFYCSELSVNDSLDHSEYWETILINNASVVSFYIQDNVAEDIKKVTLILNCPCHNLITTSACTNPALNSIEINLSFSRVFDVYYHLEKIYGEEKYAGDIINNENGHFEISLNENFHKRKVSDSSPIPLGSVENENIIPETGEAKRFCRISESSEVIEINPEEEHTFAGLEIHHTKKIYNSEVIHLLPEAVSHVNSNGLQDNLEDDGYEIIPCSKTINSLKLPSSEINGIQEKPTNIGQKRKKRMRRRSERIKAMRISPASETSSSWTDINIESLKLRKNNFMDVEKKKEINNMEEETKESFTTANIQGNDDDIAAKTYVNDCILDKNLHFSDQNHNLTEINKVKKIENEKNDNKSDILDENVVVIEDSLNEKCFETVVQNNENKYSQNMATNDDDIRPLSKKLKTCALNNTNVRSQDNSNVIYHSKVSNVKNKNQVTEELDESPKTIYSDINSKKQTKKVRLYNLENAPVYDVPPIKSPNRSFSPKEVHPENPVCELDASNEDGYNRKSNLSRKRNLNARKRTLSISDKKKMEEYDLIQDSDEDFEENSRRDYHERKKRPKTLSSYNGTSSKKKKTEASQTDKNETPSRTRREAAVKAMKVNKRILDPTTEVACDEIEIMRESDDSPKTPGDQPIKKMKYAKVFQSRHTDTETGSSEVSWLKPKSRPLFESPKKSYSELRKNHQKKKSLPVKPSTKKSEQKKKKNAHHSLNIETKSTNWSEFENFNLTIEKGTKVSHSVLKDLENELKNLSTSSYSRSVKSAIKDLSLNQPVQESSLNNNVESKDGSGEINLLGEYIEPNTDYINACDDIQDNDGEERQSYNVINDESNYVKDLREIKQSRKQKQTSSNSANSDEIPTLEHPVKPARPFSQSAESSDSFHMGKKSKSSQSLLPENEHSSEFSTDRNIDCLVPYNNERENKKWLLQRFLEYSVQFSDCVKPLSSSNINSGSKGHTAENDEKTRRAKTESPVSWTRRKNSNCLSSSDFSIFKNAYIKDKLGKKFEHYKNSLHDDLSLRNSVDPAHLESNKSVTRCANKMKQKKISSTADEKSERPRKRSKLHENLDDQKNCILDCLRQSSAPSSGKKYSRNMDTHNFGNKTTKKNLNFENGELNQSGNHTKKTNLKSNNVLDNSLHSKITNVSFKEIETDRNWFSRITSALSQDADDLTKKLLATVQKFYVDYSAKMCFLREAVLKATESFELSPKQNPLKLKNLIQTCSIIRVEVEKSLNAMQMIGREYFDAEENNYRKINRKYVKASRKYFSGMQSAKKNAIRKLEGNVYLKAKYFFRKFLKYIDSV